MSKSSNKAKIEQIKAWLEGRKTQRKKQSPNKGRESRSDYYKKQGFRGANI